MSRARGFQSRHVLFKAVALAACFGGSVFGLEGSCTGPQALQFQLRFRPDAATYTELGKWFGEHKQFPCAVEAFRAGLQLKPASADLAYLLGLALYTTGNSKDAIAPLQQAIQATPKVLQPHLILAAAFGELQRRDNAKAEYETALRIDPRSTTALSGLSQIFLAEGNYPAVINLLRSAPLDEALTLDLADAYGKARMLNPAAQILASALHKNPSSLRLTNALATVYVNQTRYEEAVQIAETSVSLHPDSAEAQELNLHLLVLNHQVDAAKALAKKLLASHSHDFEVLYLNGVLEREQRQYAAARQHLEEAVKLNPTHFNARYNLGIVLTELNDPKEAKEQLQKALALGAGTAEPQLRYRLSAVLRTLGEDEEAEKQSKLTENELQRVDDNTTAASKSAEAEVALKKGDTQRAVTLYRDAVEARPNDAMLNYKLAVLLDRTGDTSAERDALEQVVKIDPTFALAQNQIGYLASRDGDLASAEEHFRLAVSAAPRYAEAWLSLAATLGMESRIPEALAAVANAIKLDRNNNQALKLRQELSHAQGQH
jgi:tetratricopeptide (TPR) repeat protein